MSTLTVSKKELATRLGLSVRQLGNLIDAGVVIPSGGRFDALESERRYRLFRDRPHAGIAALVDDVERALLRAERAVARLSADEPDDEEVRRVGPLVERADALMRLVAACRPASERAGHEAVRREVIGDMVMRLLDAASLARAKALAPINGGRRDER
jgi:hypothetical protein